MHPTTVRPTFMRAVRLLPAALSLAAAPALAQQPRPATMPVAAPGPSSNSLAFGFGMTAIDGKNYYLFNASPEFSLGPVGVGLDLNLRFDADSGRLYKPDWRNGRDAFKAIRYIRYGSKEAGSPLYVRAGALDRSTLGYGDIMYLYNNSVSYDARKRGAELGADIGIVGLEAMYGNFARPEVMGTRAFVRPLHATHIPVLSRLEFGGTVAADFAKDAGVADTMDYGAPVVFGGDVGIPLLANSLARWTLYADATKIRNAGKGAAVGTQLNLAGMGMFHLSTRLEHRIIGDQYMPSFFNSFYELDRLRIDPVSGLPVTRFGTVATMVSPGNGAYGELTGDFVGMLTLTGSYQRLYKESKSGWAHFDLGTGEKMPSLVLRGSYDKWGIQDEKDLVTLDDRSIARLETGYRPMRWVTISMLSEWTFAPVYGPGDQIIDYTPQKRLEPRISFGFSF